MNIDSFKHEDNWQDVKDSTMTTVGKQTGKYPDSNWKKRLIMSEHSPIRRLKFYWKWTDLKSWVSVHMVRHKIGIEHWVKSQRSDRTGISRDELPQAQLIEHACETNAQALIYISRKRLCSNASKETREAYVSNSFNCHVSEQMSPIEKQDKEERFWQYFNGGKDSVLPLQFRI